MYESNTFNQLNHEHMITHEPSGLNYMDATRMNAPMNHNGSRTDNGPKDQCINANMNEWLKT